MSEAGGDPDRRALEEALGHHFGDPALLEVALTHASCAHEAQDAPGNDRLEFLGDAVLDLVVARLLYEANPDWPEGELTRARAALVNGRALADCARALDLGRHVRLGRTEQRSGGTEKTSILANVFEAVLGALYLDAGLEPVETLVEGLLGDATSRGAQRDAKTAFQEWAHAHSGETPTYRTAHDSGTEDDEERFRVEVRIGGEVWGCGVGRSKRNAERRAAREALARSARRDG